MGCFFHESIPAAHFNMFRCPVRSKVDDSGLSEIERRLITRRQQFEGTGRGYVEIQSTKVMLFEGFVSCDVSY